MKFYALNLLSLKTKFGEISMIVRGKKYIQR